MATAILPPPAAARAQQPARQAVLSLSPSANEVNGSVSFLFFSIFAWQQEMNFQRDHFPCVSGGGLTGILDRAV